MIQAAYIIGKKKGSNPQIEFNRRGSNTMIRSFLLVLGLMGTGSVMAVQDCDFTIPETTPTERFIDNGDSTVTDKVTSLTWKRCAEGQAWDGTTCSTPGDAVSYTWSDALQLNGGADWRLPNIKELVSIVERSCYNPAINQAIFPNPVFGFYWSSSTYAGDVSRAWATNMLSGSSLNNQDKSPIPLNRNYVRLVRGGL